MDNTTNKIEIMLDDIIDCMYLGYYQFYINRVYTSLWEDEKLMNIIKGILDSEGKNIEYIKDTKLVKITQKGEEI